MDKRLPKIAFKEMVVGSIPTEGTILKNTYSLGVF